MIISIFFTLFLFLSLTSQSYTLSHIFKAAGANYRKIYSFQLRKRYRKWRRRNVSWYFKCGLCTLLCQSSAQIDPEKYPEQNWPKMVNPAKKLSPAESSLNFSPPSGMFLFRRDSFRIDFSIQNCQSGIHLVDIWSIRWRFG